MLDTPTVAGTGRSHAMGLISFSMRAISSPLKHCREPLSVNRRYTHKMQGSL